MADPGFEQRELEKNKCLNEALIAGTKTAAYWLLGTASAVGIANQYWPAFRNALGVSGKTALIISAPFGMFFLQTELTMGECARRKVWRDHGSSTTIFRASFRKLGDVRARVGSAVSLQAVAIGSAATDLSSPKPDKMKRKEGIMNVINRRNYSHTTQAAIVAIVALFFFGGTSTSSTPTLRYAIVFDAGSTGSRIHVFKFTVQGGSLDLESDTFEQLKPGLSSYADDPPAAATSLEPLMKVALATVPEKLQASTPVMLGATAGLRLLPEGKADIILQHVRQYLEASPFQLVADGVRVIDGTEEGAFAWLTLNYLLGNLGKPPSSTVAAIDLGGGSVQQAFALPSDIAQAAPQSDYVMSLSGGGRQYSVYVHSYLGFGLMAGRAAVLQLDTAKDAHPCVPKEHAGEYEYAGTKHPMKGHPEGTSYDKCASTVVQALHKEKDCGAPQEHCSFNGVWNGQVKPEVLYVSSYFWDRANDVLLIAEQDAVTASLTVGQFGTAAQEACNTALPDVVTRFPRVQELQAPFLCMDLSFMHALLHEGFGIPDARSITLVKRIEYKGNQVEAAWPLGAAINMMS